MAINNLWVVMPVYNEEESIEKVLREWVPALEKLNGNYVFCVLNDGSKDDTVKKINTLVDEFPHIKLINKPNTGHGKTCILGYQMAIENGAEWVFQIDSDGQCDARYFEHMVTFTNRHRCIYGIRKTREDGMKRVIVSYFVSLFTFAATGKWIPDANVPYRLMHREVVKKFVYEVPEEFYLANIFVSLCCTKLSKIKWVPIHFRERIGGVASVKTFTFVKHSFLSILIDF